MKYYCLSDHCRFVKGTSGSAIYDFMDGRVIPVNPSDTQILLNALKGNIVVENEARQFLDDLEAKRLLNYHDFQCLDHIINPQLKYVWLELTNRCNCRCIHCYGAFGKPLKEEIQNELSLDEWKNVIDDIYAMNCRAVQFIGGEPMIHKNFCDLLQYSSDKGITRIDIFTNGYFLTDDIADIIQRTHASVRISLYGYDSKSHDSITQHPGSFAHLDRALDILKKRNIPTKIAVVLMRENQNWLTLIKAYIHEKGFQYSGFDTVRTVKHSEQDSHAVTNLELIRHRCITSPDFKITEYQFSMNRQWNNCWFGKLSITAKGDVIPCIFARDLLCGNIRTDDHNIIRQKLLSYWRITKDHVETCKKCEFRYACHDCRPLAMGDGDGIYSKYPRCAYKPDLCEWQLTD